MDQPLATVRPNPWAVGAIALAAIGIIGAGAYDVWATSVAEPFYGAPFAIGLLKVSAGLGLIACARIIGGPTVELYEGRIAVTPVGGERRLFGRAQLLAFGHQYQAPPEGSNQVVGQVNGLIFVLASGELACGGLLSLGERPMREALMGRVPFVDLAVEKRARRRILQEVPGREADTFAPVAAGPFRLLRVAFGVACLGVVCFGTTALVRSLEQTSERQAPVRAANEVHGTLEEYPRLFLGDTRPNALRVLMSEHDSLAFVVSSRDLTRFRYDDDDLVDLRDEVMRWRPGDTLTFWAYADEMDGSEPLRWHTRPSRRKRGSRPPGVPAFDGGRRAVGLYAFRGPNGSRAARPPRPHPESEETDDTWLGAAISMGFIFLGGWGLLTFWRWRPTSRLPERWFSQG